MNCNGKARYSKDPSPGVKPGNGSFLRLNAGIAGQADLLTLNCPGQAKEPAAGALAEVYLNNARKAGATAAANLKKAETALQALKKGSRPEDITPAQAQVEAADALGNSLRRHFPVVLKLYNVFWPSSESSNLFTRCLIQ